MRNLIRGKGCGHLLYMKDTDTNVAVSGHHIKGVAMAFLPYELLDTISYSQQQQ